MNKLFEQFTEEAKTKFAAVIATDEFASFIQKTAAATDSGTFRTIISTQSTDRQGDSVDQNLWDLENYQNNPIVLWAHDYSSLPIGMATKIETQTVAGETVLVAEGKFAPAEANPFAQQVRALYDAGIVRATSVGFIPAPFRMDGKSEQGNELLEFSFVPVPANPQALSLAQAKELGLDLGFLKTKGIEIELKDDEPDEGDVCQLDDGTEGVLELDGNGDLQCVPKPSKTDDDADADEQKAQKAGRTLSTGTREKIKHTIEAVKAVSAALEELLTAADSQGDERKDNSDDGSSSKQRSTPAGSGKDFNFNDWHFSREVLRAIVTSGSDALERFNKAARAKARQK